MALSPLLYLSLLLQPHAQHNFDTLLQANAPLLFKWILMRTGKLAVLQFRLLHRSEPVLTILALSSTLGLTMFITLHLIFLRWALMGVTGVTRGKVKPSNMDTAAAIRSKTIFCFLPSKRSTLQCQTSFADLIKWPCGCHQGRTGWWKAMKWEEHPAAAEPGCQPATSAPVRAHKGHGVVWKTLRRNCHAGEGGVWVVPSDWRPPHSSWDHFGPYFSEGPVLFLSRSVAKPTAEIITQ